MQRSNLLFTAFLLTGSAYAGEPMLLSNSQMDGVSAGGVYSTVSGEASAGLGSASIKTSVKAYETPSGTTISRGTQIVRASGTDASGSSSGESGGGNVTSSDSGQASVGQGKVLIRTVTFAKENANGEVVTNTHTAVFKMDTSNLSAANRDGVVTTKLASKL